MTGQSFAPQGRALVREVRERCAQEQMFPPGTRALVMVSGGQDSLTLLDLLSTKALGKAGPDEIVALHVNHHLRGGESEADEALVRQHCAQLKVAMLVEHRPVEKAAGNVQEVARTERREAALRVAAEQGCSRIALGHTVDDQVETMLYRLGRYGGLAALRGMLPCDPPWVRPLLSVRRAQTEAYCREHSLQFAVDRGNEYPGYARTGLRYQVVPAWEAALPGAVKAAARTAEVAAEVESAAAFLLAEAGFDPRAERLSVSRVRSLPAPARRLFLHEWLVRRKGRSASRREVLAVEALLESSGTRQVALGAGLSVVREYELLLTRRAGRHGAQSKDSAQKYDSADEGTPSFCPVLLDVPGRAVWNGVVIAAEWAERFCAPDPTRETYVDAAAVQTPLLVRGILPGDRIWPLGAPGFRKVHDVLVDLRVPARRRASVPVVLSGERLLWVCGLVFAEQGKIRKNTRSIVRLSVE